VTRAEAGATEGGRTDESAWRPDSAPAPRVTPILERIFGATYEDMRRMETLLRGSGADWVCLRPPRLASKKAVGRYRIDASRPLQEARSITYADLATALADSLTRPDLYRRIAHVAS
jgi:putative NADH-flavin reductase